MPWIKSLYALDVVHDGCDIILNPGVYFPDAGVAGHENGRVTLI
jgi:hypothetical protein